MSDAPAFPPVLLLAVGLLLVYRAAMASLLEAFHALTSLHRRRLLEEEAIRDPLLAQLFERPRTLGLCVSLWNQALLVLILVLLHPLRELLPGGLWTLMVLVLGYLWAMDLALPTLLTGRDPALWVARLFPLYAPVHRLMGPAVAPLERLAAQPRELPEREAAEEEVHPEAVTALLEEGEAEGILEEDDRELIRNLVGFGDTVVRELMTPRTRIQALSVTAAAEEAWAAFREGRHSRMPVYDGSIDHIVGILILKDLLQHGPAEALDLRALMKPPISVPESKPSLDLLRELQRARTQLAVVVDEFGGVSGVVTVEDLLEEVFGEIREEHESQAEFQPLPDGSCLVSGQVHVEDLEARLGLSWERDGFDTVAGLVMARLGHVPRPGEALEVEGARLVVQRMEGARVLQVLVAPREPAGGL